MLPKTEHIEKLGPFWACFARSPLGAHAAGMARKREISGAQPEENWVSPKWDIDMHTVCGELQCAKLKIWRKCKEMEGCIKHPMGCRCHPTSGCNRHPPKVANSGRF